MPALIVVCSTFLLFAVTVELLALDYHPATLVALFLSLPIPQQIAWGIICLVPLVLLVVAVLQHVRLIEKNKVAESLETRLHSIRLEIAGLDQNQKESDQAAQYLNRSEPEGAVTAVQTRMTKAEQAIQFHQERHLSGEMTAGIEQLRQKQHEIRQKLGEVIAKRRSIETSIVQLQSSQEEMEKTISEIEQDATGDTLDRRLQKLSQFVATANTRSEEIERALQGLLELEARFDALQRRLMPLEEKGIGVLAALSELRDHLEVSITRLERDQGMSLTDRIEDLRKTRDELDERVSTVLAQLSEIEAIHKDMTGLFARVNHPRRMPREHEAAGPEVAVNGNGADRQQDAGEPAAM
jgi:uncharacterized coiled-coil DUF342 family protein